MKSFTNALSDFTTLTNDSSSGNTALGKILLNIGVKKTLGLKDFTFNKDKITQSSGTNIQYYELPYNLNKIDYAHYWYGNRWYALKEVELENQWRMLNQSNASSSIPYYWYYSEHDKQIGFYPKINTSAGTIEIGFTKKKRNLNTFSDYSTGSISAFASGTILTGIGTSWGSTMIGRYLQVGSSNTQADGFWFEIINITSGGSIIIREKIPETISGGTYVISEIMPFPEGSEDLPLYYALDQYYKSKEKPVLAREWERMYQEGTLSLIRRDDKTANKLITQNEPLEWINPNQNSWDMFLQ